MPNITKRFVESLIAKNYEFVCWDDKLRGFGVKVTPRGKVAYIYKYRTPLGRQRKPNIGIHGNITCEQARKIAQEWAALLVAGKDPLEQRDIAKAELTFGELFEIYIERHAKPYKKRWKYDAECYQRHLEQPYAKRHLSTIKQEEMHRLHQKLGEASGPSMANRVLSLVRLVYNKGVQWGYAQDPIPTKHVRKFKEKARERFLQAEELPRFFDALAMEPNEVVRDIIYMLLYTGARKSNVLSMRWEDVSLAQRQWRIAETKNGESQTVPLVPQAVELLETRKVQANNSPWVFPGTGEDGHYADPKKGWRRILERAEIENLTMHDLRRTMGSYQTIMGASAFIVGKSLGHKDLKSTQIYARLNLDPVQQSMQNAVDAMVNLGQQTQDE